ncbi:MAG: 4Fe-4S dicluster domain-containing protein [Deltaproteobacteria bacterium]|nr:4Fe-4S dicluster domain-containing protein [Deltaproteobacteria bacterium]
MSKFATVKTNNGINRSIAELFRQMLEKQVIKAVLIPAKQPSSQMVMQTLITNPNALDTIDPFAPVSAVSSAKSAAALTNRSSGEPIAAVMRNCEIRAFIELVKLHQGSTDDLIVIGTDCLGRYENREFLKLAGEQKELTTAFLAQAAGDKRYEKVVGAEITTACKSCLYPIPKRADVNLCIVGAKPGEAIWLEAQSEKGEEALGALGLETTDEVPAGRQKAVDKLIADNSAFREKNLAAFAKKTENIDGLSAILSSCINCYNCRVACPVCYCRECVFVTDTFRHDGEQYLKWSEKRGKIKVPTDTVFYHLTRMIHMSTLCVGCGQCSSACPNDIPLSELFATVADRTQKRFEYLPGRDLQEGQPLATFHTDEFNDVTGQVK